MGSDRGDRERVRQDDDVSRPTSRFVGSQLTKQREVGRGSERRSRYSTDIVREFHAEAVYRQL